MNESDQETFQLYKELYFHEIDMREHANARVQIPLAITVSLVGAASFMLTNVTFSIESFIAKLFFAALGCGYMLIALSIIFLIRSWWGYTYNFLPSAESSEKYRVKLIETYKPFDDGESIAENYFKDYLKEKFISCSSLNTRCNDKRALQLHRANGFLIAALLAISTAYFIYYMSGLKSEQTQIQPPLASTMLEQVRNVTEKETPAKPPAPPKPPESRVIKEGVKVIPSKSEDD